MVVWEVCSWSNAIDRHGNPQWGKDLEEPIQYQDKQLDSCCSGNKRKFYFVKVELSFCVLIYDRSMAQLFFNRDDRL